MTDFLQRVSLMARDLPPLVQPLVVSRYAPDAHPHAPELPPDEHNPFESAPEHASHPAAQSLSPYRPPLTTEPTVRRAARQTAANNARQENTPTPPSRASDATTATQPAATQSADNSIAPQSTAVTGDVSMPFHEPLTPTRTPLNTEALIEPGQKVVTRTTEEAHAHAAPRQEADTFSASESAPPTHVNEASAQARPSSGAETIARSLSGGDAFTPDTGPEHEFEAPGLSAPLRSSAPPPPRSGNERSFGQATPGRVITRRDDAQLPSTRHDRAADAPPGGVIRVTIGRIEVRAVQPTPSQPVEAAAPPAPKLSLDEYLRQHNGRSQ